MQIAQSGSLQGLFAECQNGVALSDMRTLGPLTRVKRSLLLLFRSQPVPQARIATAADPLWMYRMWSMSAL